jgi:DMSO/TMAO reductase YedYZ molybdopterin-dependent catalytic subunit
LHSIRNYSAGTVRPSPRVPEDRSGIRRGRAAAARICAVQLPKRLTMNSSRRLYKDITAYNNFYEFGSGKSRPGGVCRQLENQTVVCRQSRVIARNRAAIALEDFLAPHPPEERIYRLRCVEAWSMVVPWLGIPLNKILPRFQPTASAKYVEFTTLLDPAQMPATAHPSCWTGRIWKGCAWMRR